METLTVFAYILLIAYGIITILFIIDEEIPKEKRLKTAFLWPLYTLKAILKRMVCN